MSEISTAHEPITLMMVDDHAIIREGLRLMIANQPNLKLVGEASNFRDALEVAGREKPDVILLDVDLGSGNALDGLPELRKVAPESRVLVLTSSSDPETHARAMRQGAMGLVSKEKVGAVLLKAVEKVYEGEVWFDRTTMGTVLSELARNGGKRVDPEAEKIATLTARELEVVTLLCEGLKNKQIGSRLFISETTVRHHLTSVFDKLGVDDRLELLLYSFRHGLAQPPTRPNGHS